MARYFAGIGFTIEADSEEEAEQVQRDAATLVLMHYGAVVDFSADEPVELDELDEFGHAG